MACPTPENTETGILIIDDYSTPAEFEALKSFVSGLKNIKIIRQNKNQGVIKTFELGLLHSNADYIMLSDQDDYWLPSKILESYQLIKRIENNEPTLVFTNLRPVDKFLQPIGDSVANPKCNSVQTHNSLLFQNSVAGCTVIFNRKLKEFSLPFPHKIPMHDHWLALLAAFGGNIGYVSEPQVLYRQHGANAVGTPQRKLVGYLKSPFATRRRLDDSLITKASQISALHVRLSERRAKNSELELPIIAQAFLSRGLDGLHILLKQHVFPSHLSVIPLALAFLSLPRRDGQDLLEPT